MTSEPSPSSVERLGERCQGRVGGGFEADLAPPQPRDHDVCAEEAARLRGEPGEFLPFGRADQQLGVGQLADAADVVLVQVGQDCRVDIGGGVPERVELVGQRVGFADVESGQAVVDDPVNRPGKYASSVTEARSCPVSKRTSPLACSMT
jgi:hypothetical protein